MSPQAQLYVSLDASNMFLTLKNAGKTNSPVPRWALERIKMAFTVEELHETAGPAAASGARGP